MHCPAHHLRYAVLPDRRVAVRVEAINVKLLRKRRIGKITRRLGSRGSLVDDKQLEVAVGFEDGVRIDIRFVVFRGRDDGAAILHDLGRQLQGEIVRIGFVGAVDGPLAPSLLPRMP